MNEKEKKAIEDLKNLKKGIEILNSICEITKAEKDEVDIKAIDIVLNLINKQQKEIEKYEQQIDLEFVEKNFIEKNKVVSKDKIRERIKELESKNEENKSELAKGIDRLNFDIIENAKNNIAINVNVRDILKELLEENNEESDPL